MFGETKYKYLQNIITIRNPLAAQGAVKELRREFDLASTSTKKLRIARATQLAANRAKASASRKGVSSREVSELRQVADIYSKAAGPMFKSLIR